MLNTIDEKMMGHLVTSTIRVAMFNAILGLVVVLYFHFNQVAIAYPWLWLAVMVGISFLRYILAKIAQQDIYSQHMLRNHCLLIITVTITGVLWGAFYWQNYEAMNLFHRMIVLLVIAGAVAGSIVSLAASPFSYYGYILPAGVAIIYCNFQSMNPESLTVGVLIFLFISFSVVTYNSNRRILLENTELLSKQEDLIEDLKQFNKKLSIASTTDDLTQLANRRHFSERLLAEWIRAKRSSLPISVLIIDIDYFKQYNDNYGHLKGDECLRKISYIIDKFVRRDTDLAARFGGDEFAVVLYDSNEAEALQVANKIQHEVKELELEHEFSKITKFATISIGVATMTPNPNDDYIALLIRADKALYKAKENGRNQIYVADDSAE